MLCCLLPDLKTTAARGSTEVSLGLQKVVFLKKSYIYGSIQANWQLQILVLSYFPQCLVIKDMSFCFQKSLKEEGKDALFLKRCSFSKKKSYFRESIVPTLPSLKRTCGGSRVERGGFQNYLISVFPTCPWLSMCVFEIFYSPLLGLFNCGLISWEKQRQSSTGCCHLELNGTKSESLDLT